MKYYLFIAGEIGNVGGGQLYIDRKSEYLRECGYSPLACYFLKSPVVIKRLKRYEKNFIREMQLPYAACTLRIRERAAEKILSILRREAFSADDEVVIESYNNLTSMWGEWFAEYLRDMGYRANHLLYYIVESPAFPGSGERELALFKLGEGQLKCIKPAMLQRALPEVDCADTLVFACESTSENVAEIEVEAMRYEDRGNFTILSIGRLDKPYIPDAFKSIAEFARRHSEEEIDVIIVGDAQKRRVRKRLLRPVRKCSNIRLINLGYQFPLPREVMRRSDVMVGVAGSVRLSHSEGVPAISIDSGDFKGIGIFNEDTQSTITRRADEAPVEVADLLERVYKDRDIRRKKREGREAEKLEVDCTPYLDWIESAGKKVWAGIREIKPQRRKEKIFNRIMRLKGEYLLYLLKIVKRGL